MKMGVVWMILAVVLALPVLAHNGIDDGHITGNEANASLPLGVIKILEYREQLAASITFLAAFLAGIVSFTSPCGFVLLPTFFTILFKERKQALLMTALFTLGLMAGFVLLGIGAAFAGAYINEYRGPFAIFSGIVFLLFGFLLLFNKGFGTFHPKLGAQTPWGLLLFGFAFAFGWSPCIGPILGGILILAATTGSALKGAILLALFALGVGLPLLLVAVLSDKYDWARWTGKNLKIGPYQLHTFNLISAILLLTIGTVMILYRGTGFIELTISRIIPWSMTFFYAANDTLQQNTFFTSGIASTLGISSGIILFLLLLWLIIRKH